MAGDAVAVVRSVWDAYLAEDVERALSHFAPDAEWHSARDFPAAQIFRGREQLRLVLDTTEQFSARHVAVNEIVDMGTFVLAHGVVYAEQDGEVVIDRVTTWRFYVREGLIARVDAEPLPSEGYRLPRRREPPAPAQ
jgi:ketosteroid isomerase-like protein